MKKSIRNVLCFSMIVFCMFIGGLVLSVDAEETSTTITDTGYTVTIPSEVSIDSSSNTGSIAVSASDFTNYYSSLTVSATSNNNNKLQCVGNSKTYEIPYTLGNDSLTFNSSTTSGTYNLSVSNLDEKIKEGLVSGTYTDTLTFNISGTKNKYKLDLNGKVDGVEKIEGGDLPTSVATVKGYKYDSVTQAYVEQAATTSNTGWWQEYDAGTKLKFVVTYNPKQYSLSRVENNSGKNLSDYGFTVAIDNDNGTATIEGVISGQNAINNYGSTIGYATRIDLCFTTKTYDLTLDYYKLAMDGATAYESTKDGESITRYHKTIKDVVYGSDISDYLPSDLTTDKDEDIGVVYLGWHTEDQPSSGWKDIEESKRFTSTTMPAENTTLYTWWTKTIYLDLDGQIENEDKADGGNMYGFATANIVVNRTVDDQSMVIHNISNAVDSYLECQYGDTYEITAMANPGYTYVGVTNPYELEETPSLTGIIHRKNAVNLFVSDSTKANEWAVKVNLVFRRNTFTVKFNSNGGEGTMSNQSFSYGKTQNLTECAFTKTGYKFVGWSTSENGTDTIVDQSDGSTLTTTDNDTVTLYAKWEANTSGTDTESDESGIALTSLDDENINVLSESDDVVSTDSTNEVMLDADEIVEDISEVEQTEN